MIIDSLSNISRYSSIIPKDVIDFMKELTPDIALGRYNINDRCYVNVDEYEPKRIENCHFEAHKKYIDIQMVLKGEEEMQITASSDLNILEQYDENRDVMFFEDGNNSPEKISLTPFKFVYIYPQEAHKPQIKININSVKKIVVKIAV